MGPSRPSSCSRLVTHTVHNYSTASLGPRKGQEPEVSTRSPHFPSTASKGLPGNHISHLLAIPYFGPFLSMTLSYSVACGQPGTEESCWRELGAPSAVVCSLHGSPEDLCVLS